MLRTAKHREVMYFILRDVFDSKYARNLAFKGGTLCYFLYGLDRFSTDLDFDCVSMPEDEADFIETISSILRRYGMLKQSLKKKHTYFFLLSYWHDDMNIKFEANARIWKANRYETMSFFGTPILAMEKSTIFANKLVALTDRENFASRDAYDVHFFFRNLFDVNEDVVIERTGKTLKEYYAFLLDYLRSEVPWRNLLQGLGEVVDAKRKAFVKEKLLSELEGIVSMKLAGR